MEKASGELNLTVITVVALAALAALLAAFWPKIQTMIDKSFGNIEDSAKIIGGENKK